MAQTSLFLADLYQEKGAGCRNRRPRCPIREDANLYSRVYTLCPAAFLIEEVQDAHDKEVVHVPSSETSAPAIISVD